MKHVTRKFQRPGDGDRAPGVTGTYVYDERLGRVVRVSGRIPRLSAGGGSGVEDSAADVGPCGRTECGGGSCAAQDSGEGLGDLG